MTDARTGGRAAARRGGGTSSQTPSASGGDVQYGGRAAARKNRKRGKGGRKKVVLIVALVLLTPLVAGGGYLGYTAWKLDHNIKSDNLFNGTTGNAGVEKADAFGRTPINLLVIGSDGRDNKADCKIGGDCGPGANADVEMVVHISADRSNATVMSIPRDLETELPACTDAKTGAHRDAGTGMINSVLTYGPGCSVAAIHQLTGIPIDHFAMIDFSGVVNMSDAVGGVSVCVDNNVYDPYSHLKLKKGTHVLKGLAALEFVRTRHGFGNGGDLGRADAQHIFLTQTINAMKSSKTFTNPGRMLSLATAATKALTVDSKLKSITSLLGLADDLNKVPTDRMTFTTMQTGADPADVNRLVIAAGAQTLFNSISNDQSLTTATGKATAAGASATASAPASAAPTYKSVPSSQIAVRVENGSTTPGRATALHDALVQQGYSSNSTIGNAPSNTVKTTSIEYGTGRLDNAKQVAASLGLPASALKQTTGTKVTLVIGADWPSGLVFPGGTAKAPAVNTKVALNNASAKTGNQVNTCAHVGTQDTVSLPGYGGMTPIRAYALSPKVKDSAP
ncbi:LCP family protein [Streptacidiphilus sp. N1-3]|uniref:LCP family protein n=1 Tax=Streptacidiphilus alkalitolerans TaxID=3342712 RepID=A0ABV6X7P3_9ACTN